MANNNKKDVSQAPENIPAQAVWYRIKGPGGVKLNGVFYQEGATLQIFGADAQSIDGYLEVLPGADAQSIDGYLEVLPGAPEAP